MSDKTSHLIDTMFERILGGSCDQIAISRNMPMNLEVDVIQLMELFEDVAPHWGDLAAKYRELQKMKVFARSAE